MNSEMIKTLRERVNAFTGDDRPSHAALRKHALAVLTLAETITAKAAEVRDNTLWPVEHRQRMLRQGVTDSVKAIQRIENEIADVMHALGLERRARERLPVAPSDPVSVQLRAEARAMRGGMSTQDRLAATRIDKLDANTFAAILEAPAALSGLPERIVGNLRPQLLAVKGIYTERFDVADTEAKALTGTAIEAARMAAAAASEIQPSAFASRVDGVRTELTAAVDRSDADLGTLLQIATEPRA
jgi:hypothetical protein